jgi:hypothetical protein
MRLCAGNPSAFSDSLVWILATVFNQMDLIKAVQHTIILIQRTF